MALALLLLLLLLFNRQIGPIRMNGLWCDLKAEPSIYIRATGF